MLELNKVYCGDFRNFLNILPKIDLVATDPPYNVNFNYDSYSDNLDERQYIALLASLKSYKSVFIQYPEETIKYLSQALGYPQKIVSWVYPSNLPRQHRSISWYNCKPDFSKIKQPYKNPNDKRIKALIENGSEGTNTYDWWEVPQVKNVSDEKTDHPCQIPVEIMSRIILLTTNEGDTILDPFMGSGTTAIACIRTNRNYIGIEQSSQYFLIANKRIKNELDQLKLAI